MFGDNKKFLMGDSTRSLDRGFLNNIYDASVNNRSAGQGPILNGDSPDGSEDQTTRQVKNDSGQDLDEQFKILRVGEPLITPANNLEEWNARQVFNGLAPAADQPFCVLQEPAAPDQVVNAVFAGVTPVKLNVGDTSHKFAGPSAATAELTTAETGPAEIIWKESGTGAGKHALIRLNAGGASSGSSPISAVVTWFGSGAGTGGFTMNPTIVDVSESGRFSISGSALVLDTVGDFHYTTTWKTRLPILRFPMESTIPTPTGVNWFYPASECLVSVTTVQGTSGAISSALPGNDQVRRNGTGGSFENCDNSGGYSGRAASGGPSSFTMSYSLVSNGSGNPSGVLAGGAHAVVAQTWIQQVTTI